MVCPSGVRIVTVGNLTKQKSRSAFTLFAKLDISEARLMFNG